MDRGSTAAWQTEAGAATNAPIHLVELYFDSGTIYLTDAFIEISWGGNTYQAVGDLLGFTNIEETLSLEIPTLGLSLSGVDQTYTGLLLSEDYIDRKVNVYFAFLDSANLLVSEPVLFFSGNINSPVISEDPKAGTLTVGIEVANQLINFQQRSGRKNIHSEQIQHFPGDKGFEFSTEVTREIEWG